MSLPMLGAGYLALLRQGPRPATLGDVPVDQLMLPLLAALGLSLLVERVIELLKNVADLLPTTPVGRALRKPATLDHAFETLADATRGTGARAAAEDEGEAIRAAMADLEEQARAAAQANDRAHQAELETRLSAKRAELEALDRRGAASLPETHPLETMLVEPATDGDDGDTLKTFSIQMLAVAFGIVAAHVSGLHLFDALIGALAGRHISPALDYALTGLFIGGGSGPAHVLIRFLTERKLTVTAEPAPTEPAAPAGAPAPLPVAAMPLAVVAGGNGVTAVAAAVGERWIDIPYDGGVDRELLEGIHHRRARPDTVVFHHTAMHSRSGFDDVVRVIKQRTDGQGHPWVTGYHCVVLADGSIHPFCRWDRYGNHAVGYNRTSLGISFNGNFETRAGVPYSNPDGRYGLQRPSPEQLDAGARVAALWCSIYEIPLEFTKSIIPHRFVSSKTCPGNQFPESEFKRLVDHYVTTWQKQGEGKDHIDAFRLRPYLFVTEGSLAWR